MKRFLILAAVMMLFAGSAFAQSSKYIGFKGGLNIFKPYGDDVVDAKSYYAFAAGGFYTHIFNEVFVIQPEVYYSVKGGKQPDEGEESTLKLSYIDIPVLLKVNFPMEEKSWAPNLYAGVTLKFVYVNLAPREFTLDGEPGTGNTFGADLGLLYEMGQGPFPIYLAGVVQNLGPDIAYIDEDQADPLGRNLLKTTILELKA